ncbi:hypothetical protein [Ascidiimonas aurantiaca]|uniref:hypothetical protein n=1 Tax=Ascidiimonas aurantiaca TaxID=1685432 RepID=UPI0030EB3036
MFKKVLYFLPFVFMASCYQPERNCEDFKTGKFSFTYTLEGKERTDIFYRSDSIEISWLEDTVDTSSVRWINDCEFILRKRNPVTLSDQKAVHVEILFTTKDSYTFEYNIVGDLKNKQRGTAKIVK